MVLLAVRYHFVISRYLAVALKPLRERRHDRFYSLQTANIPGLKMCVGELRVAHLKFGTASPYFRANSKY
jgi:hypothetical protein